jgi:hypothetical protein
MNLAFDKFAVAKSVFIKLFACFFNIKSDFTKNDNFLCLQMYFWFWVHSAAVQGTFSVKVGEIK